MKRFQHALISSSQIDPALFSIVMYLRLVFLMFICGSLHNLKWIFKKSYKKLKLISITKKKKEKTTLKFRDDGSNLAVGQFDVYNFKEAIFNII